MCSLYFSALIFRMSSKDNSCSANSGNFLSNPFSPNPLIPLTFIIYKTLLGDNSDKVKLGLKI